MRVWLLILAALTAFAGSVALADQRDPRLDKLFVILTKTGDAKQAAQAQAEISRIWLESSTSEANALIERSMTAASEGDVRAAVAALDAAIELAPDFAEAWYQRASMRFAVSHYLAAIADAEQALALEPRHFQALAKLGQIYLFMGDRDGALNVFEQALAINPHLTPLRAAADELRRERDRNRL